MKTLLISTPQNQVTMEDARNLLPQMPEGWQMQVAEPGKQRGALADAIVACMMPSTSEGSVKTWIHKVAGMQKESNKSPFVIFTFAPKDWRKASKPAVTPERLWAKLQTSLKDFKYPERVDLAWIEDSPGLAMKLKLIEAKLALEPRSSPLDRVKVVIDATADLHGPSGRLSATAVADVFGVSQSKLAEWLGRTRQAVSKTPEAESLQKALAFYERTARLRCMVPGEDFKKWLRVPNQQLDQSKPLDLLAKGEGQVVADLVDDMLTGSPT